jgi:hypothetical protein
MGVDKARVSVPAGEGEACPGELVGKIGVVVLGSQNSVPLFHARNFPRPPAIRGARTYELLLKI